MDIRKFFGGSRQGAREGSGAGAGEGTVATTQKSTQGGWGATSWARGRVGVAAAVGRSAGWGAGEAVNGENVAAKAVRSLLGVEDDVVVAVAQACLARGAGQEELVGQLGTCLDADDAERLAALLTGGSGSAARALEPRLAPVAEQSMPPPVWAAAERPDARLSIAELRARLGLLGVSIQGLSERSELESAHRQAMWPSPELSSPEPDVQALCELHRQLLRLALYLTPDVDERAARDGLAGRVIALAHRVCPTNPLAQRYGSEALGLAAFTSDIDMCIAVGTSRSHRSATLRWIGAALRQTTWASQVDVRANARVPIINFTDRASGLEVDISLERCETTELVETLRSDYTALEPLALVLKVLLEQADLNTPYTGGIGSFKLYVLIGHFLSSKSQDGQQWASDRPLGAGALAVLMLGVLRHAASHFDWRHTFTFASGVQVDFSGVYRSDLIVDYCAELAEQLQKEVDRETARLRHADPSTQGQHKPDDLQPETISPESVGVQSSWRGLMRVVEASRLCQKREAARTAATSADAIQQAGAPRRAKQPEQHATLVVGTRSDQGAIRNHHTDTESEDEWELGTQPMSSRARHGSKRSHKKQRKREKRERRQNDRSKKKARLQENVDTRRS